MYVLDYLDRISVNAPYIAKQLGIVSNLNTGETHTNVLFEGSSSEIFLYVDNAIDPLEMESVWEDYQSIKVIKTDVTDINYPVLFKYAKYTPGVTIFEIDIKAMMLQYYYWSKARLLEDRGIAANIFLPTIVIPNISDSLVDYAIFNRFNTIVTGDYEFDTPQHHPISIIDYSKGIDGVLEKVVKDVVNTNIYLTQLLRTIPAINVSDMYVLLQIDKSYYNIQSKWVLWVSRLGEIVELHKILGKKGRRINTPLYNRLPYEIKLIKRSFDKLDTVLDPYNAELMDDYIKYVEKNIGKR